MGLQTDILKVRSRMKASPTQGVIACLAILARHPDNPSVRRLLGRMDEPARRAVLRDARGMMEAAAWTEALAILSPIGRVRPTDPHFADAEARCLIKLDRFEEARTRLATALAEDPDDPQMNADMGECLLHLSRTDAAIEHLERARRFRGDDASVLNNLATAHQRAGNIATSTEIMRAAVRLPDPEGWTWKNLSQLVDFSAEDDLYDALVADAAKPDIPDEKLEYLRFAQAKAAFDRDDPALAFAHLEEANALHAKSHPMDHAAFADRIRALADSLSPSIEPQAVPEGAPRLVFVAGMPRSGTTLMERVLDRHPQAFGLGESTVLQRIVERFRAADVIWNDKALNALAAEYRRAVYRQAPPGKTLLVDKMPSNILVAGFALAALPEARLIHMRRDPVATAFSSWRLRYMSLNSFAYTVDGLVDRSNLTAEMGARWQDTFGDRVKPVLYERLTEAPRTEIARLLDWLDLDPDADCIDFTGAAGSVSSASALQVRKGIYTGSSESWRRYERWLTPIIEGLRPLSDRHAAALTAARSEDPADPARP